MQYQYIDYLACREDLRFSRFTANPSDQHRHALLPVRIRPFPQELLSSWLVRLAAVNGLNRASFAEILGIPNISCLREIDTFEVRGLVEHLSTLTRINSASIRELSFYDTSWRIPGVMPSSEGLVYGLMLAESTNIVSGGLRCDATYRACIECWRDDTTPYIRRAWRESFVTVCVSHKLPLVSNCERCGKRFNASFSWALSSRKYFRSELAYCRYCGGDVRKQITHSIRGNQSGNHPCSDMVPQSLIDLQALGEFEESVDSAFKRGWFLGSDAQKLLEAKGKNWESWIGHQFSAKNYPDVSHKYFGSAYDEFYEAQLQSWMGREMVRTTTLPLSG